MKKLQNNFTTPEQSKRLLELGVPADSADCFWFVEREIFFLQDKSYSDEAKDGEIVRATDYTPCWSVGRLIEICLLVFERHYFAPKAIKITIASLYGAGLIEDCVRKLEELHESYIIDFSKIECYNIR